MNTVGEADAELRRRVGRAWRQMRRGASAVRIKDIFYASGDKALDLALADALAVICQQGPMRMGELAEALQITPASTTRAVSCLAQRGYVERVKAADDQRSIMVSPTGDGQRRYEIIQARIQRALAEILSEFSNGELNQLAEYLERFVQSLDRFVDTQPEAGTQVSNPAGDPSPDLDLELDTRGSAGPSPAGGRDEVAASTVGTGAQPVQAEARSQR